MSGTLDSRGPGGIAVTGMAGCFPGAKNLDQFWSNLCNGVESITFFTDEELEAAGIEKAVCNDPHYVKSRGVLQDADLFDAAFFDFTPREAELLDPQQRLFLQCAWHALENAGCDPARCGGTVGVFAGLSSSSYLLNNLYSSLGDDSAGPMAMLGNDRDFFATRVSYKLNLKGPSLTLQTACSTSLVALHTACQSLLTYECDVALAGGVAIKLPQQVGYFHQEGGIYSPDGHCRAFDAAAGGTVGGSGVGVVVLKRLQDALANGDRIDAVVLGSAVNNDGSSKVGYMAPSVEGQAEVIATAQALAGVDADKVSYVETHGTGTTMGDPIEIAGLTKAFRASTRRNSFCAIGSVKTNVGHLDAAAGIAGFIKTVLAIRHGKIPPSLHFQQPNPQIDFASSPFYVNTTLTNWQNIDAPRVAGVSSFGIGGTNAHVILGEAPALEKSGHARQLHLLTLSARSATALDTATEQLAAYMNSLPEQNLADVAHTLQVGRHAFEHRRILVCTDAKEAATTLAACDPARVFSGRCEPGQRPVAFMFPGQGSQFPGMGQELYENEPAFKREVDACSDLLAPHLNLDLRKLLYSPGQDVEESTQHLRRTSITQPALFVVEYALARLWMEWGVKPQAMIGHSIGEFVAACIAGVMSLQDALILVATRGRLMESMAPGAMLAVPLALEDMKHMLPNGLSVAAINAPEQTVVSGPENRIAELERSLANREIDGIRLHTSHAFHSAMMDPALQHFRSQLAKTSLRRPQIPFLSNLTGTWITDEQATSPDYWVRHLRETVRFSDGVAELLREPSRVLLEVGPGSSLGNLARSQCGPDRVLLASLSRLEDRPSGLHFLLHTLGRLWLSGVEIDWAGFSAGQRRQRLEMPVYPFELRRFWVEAAGETSAREIGSRKPLDDWFYAPAWKQSPTPRHQPLQLNPGCCVLFVGATPLGFDLAARMREAGQKTICVSTAEHMAPSPEGFTINPRRPEDYVSLLAELHRRGQNPTQIIHMWSIDPQPADALERALHLGFNSLLFLAQALARAEEATAVDLAVVTRDIYEVTGSETLEPRNAMALGPCRVIPQEILRVRCRNIDITGLTHDTSLAETLFSVLTEPATAPVMALRNQFRWIQEFTPMRVQTPVALPLRQNGVYLITGGAGGIGLEVATDLARSVKARLALISRRALPPRKDWDRLLSEENNLDAHRIRKIRFLEELGAEVLLLAADCADRQQMTAAIAQVQERFGAIEGVIHAAGVADGGMIELKTAASARQVMAAKVEGTLILEELLAQCKPEFFVLFSSLSALLGGVGQVDYSSANSFLDAFAQSQRKSSHSTISIAWDAWRETGMAASSQSGVPQGLRDTHLEGKISSAEGVEAFRRALSLGIPRVVISVLDFQRTIEHQPKNQEVISEMAAAPARYARPELDSVYETPRNETERSLVAVWEELLGISPVGIHDDFVSLGGHSLLASQIVSRIRRTFQTELSLRTFFEGPTVAKVALAIIDRRASQADAKSLEEALAQIEELSEEEAEGELGDQETMPGKGASHG